jgi:hypothetical protein
MTRSKPVLVFYSYAHEDEPYRKRLAVNLAPLRRQGLIEDWCDRQITAGARWADQIDVKLKKADIIILLISPDFFASDYAFGREMTEALRRHSANQAAVVPVIISPVAEWQSMPLGQLQALPQFGKPVVMWARQALAWVNVAEGIAAIAKDLRLGRVPPRTAVRPAVSAAASKAVLRTEIVVNRADGHLHRIVCDAKNKTSLPGTVVRTEGQPPTGDDAADEAYDGLGITYRFFWNVYERDSIDGKGQPIRATVHFGKDFNNAFWDGTQIALGDGDGRILYRLTQDVDQIAARYVYAINGSEVNLRFWRQSGALVHSLACVFASLVKQYQLGQRVDEADWLLGTRIIGKDLKGKGIASLAAPGTAYHDPKHRLVDNQPGHMSSYVRTEEDSGGVHINSGIPNRAFYLAATAMGGYGWEKAGRIWYETLRDRKLKADASFKAFAELTLAHGQRHFGRRSVETSALRFGWEMVGVKLQGS